MTNRTRTTLLGNRIMLADTWWLRLRGLVWRPKLASGEGLLLVPCNAVHMFGMKYAIDVLFLDRAGRVVSIVEALRPGRATPPRRGAQYALELPAGTVGATRTREGDHLVWTPTDSGAAVPQTAPGNGFGPGDDGWVPGGLKPAPAPESLLSDAVDQEMTA